MMTHSQNVLDACSYSLLSMYNFVDQNNNLLEEHTHTQISETFNKSITQLPTSAVYIQQKRKTPEHIGKIPYIQDQQK